MARLFASDGADRRMRDSRSCPSNRKATASLILGLCAVGACFSLDNPLVFLVACGVAGLPAIVVGLLGLREIKHANMPVLGKGNAIAGIVLGTLTTILTALIPLVVEGREPSRSRDVHAQPERNRDRHGGFRIRIRNPPAGRHIR